MTSYSVVSNCCQSRWKRNDRQARALTRKVDSKGDPTLKGRKDWGQGTFQELQPYLHAPFHSINTQHFFELLLKSVYFSLGNFFQGFKLSGQYQSLTLRKTDWKHREVECHVDRHALAVCFCPVQTPRRKQGRPHVNLLHQVATCATLKCQHLLLSSCQLVL